MGAGLKGAGPSPGGFAGGALTGFYPDPDLLRVGAWAQLSAVQASGSYLHSAIPFTAFRTSNPDVFATAAIGTPTVTRNQSGDNVLQCFEPGMYLVLAAATVDLANGTYRYVRIVANTTGLDLAHHVITPANYSVNKTVDPSSATNWLIDAAMIVNDGTLSPLEVSFENVAGAADSGITLHAGAYYWKEINDDLVTYYGSF